MRGQEVVRRGPERLRVGRWRGEPLVAYIAPVTEVAPPTQAMVRHTCAVLAGRGYTEVVTGALSSAEQRPFLDTGFGLREELHLLAHHLHELPDRGPAHLRRARRRDRPRVLAIDAAAFPSFWRLDAAGLAEALTATPSTHFRVAVDPQHQPDRSPAIAGYAVCGRAGRRGYLQRLAVDPASQGRGLGQALVADGLAWLARRGVERAVVNTQVGNERARELYQSLGFRLEPSGLAVLARRLGAHQPAA